MKVSKPVLQVEVRSMEGRASKVLALFDSGSHSSIIQESKLPPKTLIARTPKPQRLKTAHRRGWLTMIGGAILYIQIGERLIQHHVLVSPDLRCEMLIGAGAMQEWGISILNRKKKTFIHVAHDIRDPGMDTVMAVA